MESERSSLPNCVRPGNGGQEERTGEAGGGLLICAEIQIVSTSDKGDESQYDGLNPNECAMRHESQAHICFQ